VDRELRLGWFRASRELVEVRTNRAVTRPVMLFPKGILHAEFEANALATSHKKMSSAARVNYLTRG
jgi:hypothetical protein